MTLASQHVKKALDTDHLDTETEFNENGFSAQEEIRELPAVERNSITA